MEYTDRQGIRFPANNGAVAWLDPGVYEDKNQFTPALSALIVNEALTGCGLITHNQDWIKQGMICMVRVDRLAPLQAEIRWVRDLGEGVSKIGVEYLE
ncbi:hypothetical protein [uncultured Thiodictyon sp.]|uniref:hypothetical protein n=1 Tax=uncultured Thiodictyon sp. TaxID=1846217 RepID=UPI0025E91A40|nr:hypothetical protein [uncultured Thiodictyon sp.]